MILSDNSKPQAINGSHSIALARLYYELRKEFCLEVEFNLFQIYSNRTKIDWNIWNIYTHLNYSEFHSLLKNGDYIIWKISFASDLFLLYSMMYQ